MPVSICTVSRKAVMTELRSRIRTLEGHGPAHTGGVSLGLPELDGALGAAGLALGCLHEVYGEETTTGGFVAAILTLLPAGTVVWIAGEDALYLPGLPAFRMEAAELLFVSLRKDKDRLRAMEEALRWPGLRAVVAELDRFDLTATRRLQLAAERSGITGFIIARHEQGLSSSVTRWRVEPALSDEGDSACWRVHLLRCRGGQTALAVVHWRDRFREDIPVEIQRKQAIR